MPPKRKPRSCLAILLRDLMKTMESDDGYPKQAPTPETADILFTGIGNACTNTTSTLSLSLFLSHSLLLTLLAISLASELSTPTPGKSSLKRLCKQFSTPLIEPGFFWSEPVFKN